MKPSFAVLPLLFLFGAACSKPADVAAKSEEVAGASLFRVEQDIVQLRRECRQYQALKGEFPPDWETLKRVRNDPWGNEYGLETEDGFLDVYSAGPDGKYGTQDDIRAPE